MDCGSEVLRIGEEEEEEEERFYDTIEVMSSATGSRQNSPLNHGLSLDQNILDCSPLDQQYKLWTEQPASVQEPRNRFRRCMGLSFRSTSLQRQDSFYLNIGKENDDELVGETDRLISDSGAELRSSNSEIDYSTSSHFSDCSSSSEDCFLEESVLYRFKNLDDGTVFVANELEQEGALRRITGDEFQRIVGRSPFVQHVMGREGNTPISSTSSEESVRSGWLKRLGAAACVVNRLGKSNLKYPDQCVIDTNHRIRVHSYKKRSKEFSAVYMSQDIQAHEGAILTMKFSPDGQYLVSGGEDGIIRVWHVIERERIDEVDLPEEDPACIYFVANHKHELAPICMNKEKRNKFRSMRLTSDSICVVIPPKIFQLSQRPLHEFHGHSGDILDLSWSRNNCILSSSVDCTVRLWHVGCDDCVQVFSHNDYVTSAQFNPANDNYFVSGSIDGKVRIWDVSCGHVVDWTDVKDIVTALCYAPDGKEVVVGSVTGHCRFYDIIHIALCYGGFTVIHYIDNHLQLDDQLPLQGKRKSSKMITGFQFSPKGRKLLVTSADSRVRILDKVNLLCKYKGFRNVGSRISSSFTKNGTHIISASEDSNVYIWNHNNQHVPSRNHVKDTSCCERFFSSNVSVAITWHGLESRNSISSTSEVLAFRGNVLRDFTGNPECGINCPSNVMGVKSDQFPSSFGSFTIDQSFLTEHLPKVSATWPEEKLPSSSVAASLALGKSQCKFLKTSCENAFQSPNAWGQVIITAGWDGRIRSFQNYGLPVHY